MNKLLFAGLFCLASLAHAMDVGGVKFDDKIKLGPQEVQLNGAGLRTRFFVKIYAMGIYLPEKKALAADILAQPGPKRIRIAILREFPASQFADAMLENIRKNHSEAELAPLKARLDEFIAAVLSAKMAHKGDVVTIDWLPESGTRLDINDKPLGKDIAGEDFYRALAKIWLGDKPVQDTLKDALLGKPQ